MHDPIDILAPSVPSVAGPAATGAAAGAAAGGATSPRIDPFPYNNQYGGNDPYANQDPYANYAGAGTGSGAAAGAGAAAAGGDMSGEYISPTSDYGSPTSGGFDPYGPNGQGQMAMPDARNYMGGGYGPTYGSMEGGYAVAAAAAGAGAYGAAHGNRTNYDGYSNQTHGEPVNAGPGATPAGIAKAREAQAARERQPNPANRTSGGYPGPSGQSPSSEEGGRTDTVYQHTDMGSLPDEEAQGPNEVPPG